jgi:hypothetical protein
MMSLLSDVASMLKKKRRDLHVRSETARVCIVVKGLLSQNDVNDTILARKKERTNEIKSPQNKTYIFQLIDGIERGSTTGRRPRTTTTFRGG